MRPELRLRFWFFPMIVLLLLAAGCSPYGVDEEEALIAANRLTTGVSGKDLLTASRFDRISFEIVYVEGHQPILSSLENLVDFADSRCFKPGGITYTLKEIKDPGITSYTTEDILSLEDTYRTRYNDKNAIAVFVLFLNGKSSRDAANSVILGTAYRNTSFVIFEETILRYSEQFISNNKTLLESTVLNHEFSHLLGLVNLGATPQTDHEDSENPNHCEVADCLMNYRTDAGIGFGGFNLGGGLPGLDEQCLADLRALGGK